MKGKRLPVLLVSGVISLALMVTGSYFWLSSFWSGDGPAQHEAVVHEEAVKHAVTTSAYLGQPDDFSRLLERSDVVVEGVLSQVYAPKWSTEGGVVPGDLESADVKDLSVHIRTPVELSVNRVFKGDSIGETIKFSFVGGRVGDVAQAFEWNEVFEKDARVIVFLSKGVEGSPARNVESAGYFPRMHLVVDGDEVHGPTKTINLVDLLEQLQ